MKKMESAQFRCFWAFRFEILGLILLITATGLTIATHNSLGIVALFASGLVLCLFNKLCSYMCHSEHSSCPVCETPPSYSLGDSAQTEVQEEIEAKQVMDNEGGNQMEHDNSKR